MKDAPSLRKTAPSPPSTPILGHARRFQRDPLGYLLATARDCGPVAKLELGPLTYHLVSEPDLVAEVLQYRSDNYVRDTRSSRSLRLVTGESLLNAEGETWRRHRRLAQPVFHQRRIAQWATVMAQAATETADAWEAAARKGRPLELASEMSQLTFTLVGRCLFGVDLGGRSKEVESAFPVLLDELFFRAKHAFALPLWLPLRRHHRFKTALAVIDEVVTRIIAARRSATEPGTDLLGLLLEARDEDGSALSDEELRNQVVTFLLAGHETTATLVTWAFCLLSQNPEARGAVEAELDRVTANQTSTAISELLPHLPHLHAALQETLRLYPSIWIAERRVIAADRIGGYTIPAGTAVIVSPYVTQRLPPLWPDPDRFDLSRWLTGEPRTLGRDGFFPFGAGPHLCIGQHFAMMEAKIILATLLARFRVQVIENALPPPLGGITLRPAGAVPVRVERR